MPSLGLLQPPAGSKSGCRSMLLFIQCNVGLPLKQAALFFLPCLASSVRWVGSAHRWDTSTNVRQNSWSHGFTAARSGEREMPEPSVARDRDTTGAGVHPAAHTILHTTAMLAKDAHTAHPLELLLASNQLRAPGKLTINARCSALVVVECPLSSTGALSLSWCFSS